MIPLEVIDALKAAGCTGDQVLAAIRADQHRLLVRRMMRRARQALGIDAAPVESGFAGQKADSRVRFSEPEGVRSAPAKSMARAGIVSSLELRPAAQKVAARLVEHLNMETGRCDPSVGRMARDLGLSERSVRRAIVELEQLGLLRRYVHAGRGLTNGYALDLKAMAALHEPIGRKADSSENRTLVAAKPDTGVRQNRVQKLSLSVGGEASPARPDPRQRELLLPLPSMRDVAQSSARKRIHADIATEAERSGGALNVSGLSEHDWAAADLAEVRRHGAGIGVLLDRLGTGPPKATGTG